VFYKDIDGWHGLPGAKWGSTGIVQSLTFEVIVSKLTLDYDTSIANTPPFTGSFRTVVVPTWIPKIHDQLDITSYEAVARYFGLPLK
jgi:hypothetical protein